MLALIYGVWTTRTSALPQSSDDPCEGKVEVVADVFKQEKTRPYQTKTYQTHVKPAAMSEEHLLTVGARGVYANFTLAMVEIGTPTPLDSR
jgi:hypothetical protein